MFKLKQTSRAVALGTFLVCASVPTTYAFAGEYTKAVTQVEGISEYQLANGLKVLLFPDQTKETVTVNVTYHVGSKHENYGETGMAHLLEHLVFKGTPNHPDIPKELSSHGARPNGTTWTDRTNYFETFAATDENINWALDMESDRMVNSFISKEDLDSEMTVVRNEFEAGENSPFGVTLKRMMASAYAWHNYGKSTIGSKADLENVPIDRLKAFYKKYYQPDNATLIVAGKFKTEDMIKRVNKYFGKIPKPTRTMAPLYTQEPAQDGERSVTVRRVGDMQLAGAMYHIPAGSHPDYAAIDILSQVLGDTPSGRLHKSLVEGKLASRSFGFNFQWQEPGLAIFGTQVDKSFDLDKTQAKMLSVIEGVGSNKITDEEVERAKRNILKNIELSFNSSERIALGLSEWLGMGDWRLFFLHRDRIEKVTTADVQRVAEQYLTRNNRTAGRFIPTDKPARVEVPQVTQEEVIAMVQNYKGREQIAQGEDFEPSFDNIDSRTESYTLKNGAKVSLLAKKTRGETVSVSMSFDFGNEKALKNKAQTASALGAMLMRGTKDLSREELQDEFDKLKANVRIGAGATGAWAVVTTTKDNLPKTLSLVEKVLKEPGFDKKEFEQYISTTKVDIESQLQDPQSIAFREYTRKQSQVKKGHPYYTPTFEELIADIDALKLKDLKAFHKKFFGGNNSQIAVVGDFDESAVKSQLADMLDGWKSKVKYKRVAMPFKKMPVKDADFDTPDKENATFVAAVTLPIGIDHKDAAALELGNYMLGGGFLNSRLATRLRQKDGLSYGAGSFINPSNFNEKTSMGAYAICAPQNLEKVEIGFKEEIARMLKDGFTAEEVASAKSGVLQGKKVSRAQDRELVSKLSLNLDREIDMQWHEKYESRLAELTAEEVNRVMRKYIKLEDFSIIKAGDMTKAVAQVDGEKESKTTSE